MMFNFLRSVLLLGLMLCGIGQSWAGAASAAVSGLQKNGAAYTFKSPTATAANGAYNTTATITSGGRIISMPASAQLAANAASFALTAVRLNPAGLITTVVGGWLITKGLSYINGEWNKTTQVTWWSWTQGLTQPHAETAAAAAEMRCQAYGGGGYHYGGLVESANQADFNCNGVPNVHVYKTCASTGTWLINGACAASGAPATEGDFVAAGSGALPDNVATELGKVVDMPVNTPSLGTTPVDSYGSPYLDPVSGRQVKELTRVTPDPTPLDPLNVRVEKYQVDAGAVAGQTANPAALPKEANVSNQPTKETEATPDLCAANPGILACQAVTAGTGAATSNLYTAETNGKTFQSSVTAFKASIAGSGLYQAAGGFWNAGTINGACAGLATTYSLLGHTFNMDLGAYLCGPNAVVFYQYLAVGMLLVATGIAFSIAIL